MKLDSLSQTDKILILSRIAHTLTVCARSTYEPKTENILEPKVLRAYNELLHQVTASIAGHVTNDKHYAPLEAIIQMMHDFGRQHDREKEITWALQFVETRHFPHPVEYKLT